MPLTIPSGLQPCFYQLYSEPLQIYELYLDTPYLVPSHYFVCNIEPITFGGHVYTPLAIKRNPIKSEDGTVLNEVEIGLDNVDLEFSTLVASGAFNLRRCVIKLVFANALDSQGLNYVTILDGQLDEPKGDNRWATMMIKPFPCFSRDYPRRLFQVQCNYTFGDSDCTMNASNFAFTYTVDDTGAVDASTCSIINFDDDTNDDDYFVPGYVLFLSGALENIVRPIVNSTSTTVSMRVSFPFAPSQGDTFKIVRLCAKTPSSCQAFGNYLNFGGFPQVPKQPII
jgi:uncharacterized phage protein (TIGR02218 family)